MTGAIPPNAEVVATIRALETERYTAMVAGDIDRFVALAHPDLLYTHSNAEVDTLESYLAKLRNRHYVYHHIDHPVHRIAVVGDTALVSGEMHADITAGGVRKRLANSALAVWVRERERWRFFGYGPTVIPGAT
ncbi:nuclear transport factor 2 family protein [Nocardia sp. NPDC050378]|uniref:nuclear transport factor 2 family protein n=1 Tax=Nocardia sp. NPDC050378 TaxID=3155400 RepID=UPI0033D92D1E